MHSKTAPRSCKMGRHGPVTKRIYNVRLTKTRLLGHMLKKYHNECRLKNTAWTKSTKSSGPTLHHHASLFNSSIKQVFCFTLQTMSYPVTVAPIFFYQCAIDLPILITMVKHKCVSRYEGLFQSPIQIMPNRYTFHYLQNNAVLTKLLTENRISKLFYWTTWILRAQTAHLSITERYLHSDTLTAKDLGIHQDQKLKLNHYD